MQPLTGEESNVGSKQGQHCLHRRVIQALLHLSCHPPDGETDADSARGYENKSQACLAQ